MLAATGRARALWIAGAVAGLSLVAWFAVVARGGIGYDPAWSLVWGRQLIHGQLPDLDVSNVAPTPHPLANLAGAFAALSGSHGPDVLLVLGAVCFALLALAAFELGRVVSGPPAGVLLAVVLVTRSLIVGESAQAAIDIPFIALVLFATAQVVRDARPVSVFVALGLAGLLRPEAWLLAVGYAVYVGVRAPALRRKQVVALGGAALAAPIIWCAVDLIATGDLFHSLHGTQDLATLLGRPRAAGSAFHLMTPYLKLILSERFVWLGFAGAIASAGYLYRRVVVPSLVFWLGLLAFVALGVAHLPVLIRYLLVPAAFLALFAALVVTGWRHLPAGGRARRVWAVAAVVGAVLMLAGVPSDVDALQHLGPPLSAIHQDTQDLQALLREPGVQSWSDRCPRLDVDGFRYAPLATYLLGRDPHTVRIMPPGRRLEPLALIRVGSPAPIRYRRVAGNGGWTLYERCAAVSASSSS